MFTLSEVQGKGMGWVSTRPIQPQTIILDEEPILTICKQPSPTEIATKLGKLGSSQYRKWREICSEQDPSEIVLKYGLGLSGEIQESLGIFEHCSRLNHSCRPNAVAAWGDGSMCIQAIDVIDVGSEITISYLTCPNGILPFRERQKMLASWGVVGFQCNCVLCSQPFGYRQLSDERRMNIMNLRSKILSSRYGQGKEEDVLVIDLISCCDEELIPLISLDTEILMKVIKLRQKQATEIPAAKGNVTSHSGPDSGLRLCQQLGAKLHLHDAAIEATRSFEADSIPFAYPKQLLDSGVISRPETQEFGPASAANSTNQKSENTDWYTGKQPLPTISDHNHLRQILVDHSETAPHSTDLNHRFAVALRNMILRGEDNVEARDSDPFPAETLIRHAGSCTEVAAILRAKFCYLTAIHDLRAGRPEQALHSMARAVRLSELVVRWTMAAHVAFLSLCKDTLACSPGDPDASIVLCNLLFSKGERAKALQAITCRSLAGDAVACVVRGCMQQFLQANREAVAEFDRAVRGGLAGYRSVEVHFLRAFSREQIGDLNGAEDDYAAYISRCGGGERKLCEAHLDRKSTRLNSSHITRSRMPSSA